jgi:hypothetical protein
MARSERSGGKWLACGCLGCLAIVVLIALVLAGAFGTAWIGVRSERVAERQLEPEVGGAAAGRDGRPGRVVLRLSSGEFIVRPARGDESLHVEALYDERNYDLHESFEDGDERWVYEVRLERKGSLPMALLRGLVGGTRPRIEVFLPTDVPLELDVRIAQGGSQMDLGGMWLTSAAIEFNQAGVDLDVSEPLREPMESLTIRGSMGGFTAKRLGDASPRTLDVEFEMGGMDLDLRGGWRTDAEITVRTNQGGGALRLPDDVQIVGLETSRVRSRGDEETPRPTLTFSVSSTRGELEIVE